MLEMQENKKLRKARISDLLRMKINGKRGRVLCHNKEESTREKTTCDQADAKSCCSTCKGASEQVARGATGAIILEVQRRVTYMRGIVMSLNQTLYKNIFRDGFFFFFSLLEGNVFGIDAMAVTDEKFGLQFGLYQQRWSILANLNKRNQSSFLKKMGNLQSGYIYVYREDCKERRENLLQNIFLAGFFET